jgi:predicted DNA-binding protein (MmcQ/YjbR family)
MEHERVDEAAWRHLLDPLRDICLSLPEANETVNFGAPWFRAGKRVFAIFARDGDEATVWFRTEPLAREALLEDGRFTPAPYMHRHGWLATALDDDTDWGELEELLVDSYRLQALKRMLRALDG